MKRLFKVLVYSLFLLLTVEIGLRFLMHYIHGMPIIDTRRYRPDEYVLWKQNPGYKGLFYSYKHARINRHGCLGNELEDPKGEDLIRIALLGGSVVLGHGVSRIEDNMASVLERRLNEENLPVRFEVVNAATTGYTSYLGRQYVEHYLEGIQPDIVYTAYGWNDAVMDLGQDSNPTDRHKRATDLCPKWYEEYFMLGAIVPRLLLAIGRRTNLYQPRFNAEGKTLVPRVPVENYTENMKAINEWCREHSVKLIYGNEPLPEGTSDRFNHIPRIEAYHVALRATARELDVPLADMDAAFEALGPNQFFDDLHKDYIHPNAKGHEVMARVLFETLQSAGYFDLIQKHDDVVPKVDVEVQ